MDITLAKSIMFEAKKGGIYEKEIPEVEAELIEEASYFITEAKIAWDEGWGKKDETVTAIYNLASASNGKPAKENFPIPPDIEKAPDMPSDITLLDDLKIRKLYSEFSAVHSRAKWIHSRHVIEVINATHMREDAYRKAYLDIEKLDEETGKPKTTTAVDLEAKSARKYLEWNTQVLQHTKDKVSMNALMEIYESNVAVLSREMTFRTLEWDKSR